jgi:orotidine-5'-phosphate decarboxylase
MVGQVVVEEAARYNPAGEPGSVGVVVGATIGRTGVDFSTLSGSILAPGIGAQGATATELAEVFGPATSLVLPSVSREAMSAGPDPAALRATTARIRGEMEAVLRVG